MFKSFDPPKKSRHPRYIQHYSDEQYKTKAKTPYLCANCGYPLGVHKTMNCPTLEEVALSVNMGRSEKTRVPMNPYPFKQ